MFRLNRQEVTVTTVNARAEKHGQTETKLAFDIFFSLKVANDVLGQFDADLKRALFKKGDSPQGELIKDENYLPDLRFPKIGTVKWSEAFPGYELRLHCGINDESDIVCADAEIDRFSFDPQKGGSVETKFRAIVHPDDKDLARLLNLIQQKVEISAEPPAPAAALSTGDGQGDLAGSGEPNAGFADAAAAAINEHKERTEGKPPGKRH